MNMDRLEAEWQRIFRMIEYAKLPGYIYLAVATIMTVKFIKWTWHFAETSQRTGTDVAMIITAIGVPLSVVTAFAFRDQKRDQQPKP